MPKRRTKKKQPVPIGISSSLKKHYRSHRAIPNRRLAVTCPQVPECGNRSCQTSHGRKHSAAGTPIIDHRRGSGVWRRVGGRIHHRGSGDFTTKAQRTRRLFLGLGIGRSALWSASGSRVTWAARVGSDLRADPGFGLTVLWPGLRFAPGSRENALLRPTLRNRSRGK